MQVLNPSMGLCNWMVLVKPKTDIGEQDIKGKMLVDSLINTTLDQFADDWE